MQGISEVIEPKVFWCKELGAKLVAPRFGQCSGVVGRDACHPDTVRFVVGPGSVGTSLRDPSGEGPDLLSEAMK